MGLVPKYTKIVVSWDKKDEMKLISISFENYKAFAKKQTIKIRPVTILIGKNSSGKSSIAKLLTLIENSLSMKFEEPLQLINNYVELGADFLDLAHNRQPSIPIKFDLEFDSGISLSVSILQESGAYKLTIFQWGYTFGEVNFSVTYHPGSGYIDEEGKIYQIKFMGFLPTEILDANGKNITSDFTLDLRIDVDYIGPFRMLPERQFHLTGRLKFENTGAKGEYAYPILGVSKLMKDELHVRVGDWYERHFNGWRLMVDDKNRPFIEIKLVKKTAEINIVDVGQGMNQALPLVVRAHISRRDSLIITEQPELHLHPAAHGDLAELFTKSALENEQNFIIETHSENVLLRIRKLIVENRYGIHKDAFVIYWVDDSQPESQQLTEIKIDEMGTLTDWPAGVFNENFVEIQEMRKAIAEKKALGK